MVTGSAGEGNAPGAARQLTRCNAPIGTIALVESQSPALAQMPHWWSGHTFPVQSGCFNVVERSQGLARMTEERELAEGGMLQQGANMGRGQMVAADYYITPNIIFSEDDAGGYSGQQTRLVA